MRSATGVFRLLPGVIVIAVGVACKAPRPAVQGKAPVQAPASVAVPGAWAAIGVPAVGLVRVLPESNEHGFYGDYAGHDRDTLLAQVERGLVAAGFKRSCNAVDGMVRGFSRGDQKLAVKIDVLDVLSLSIFDEQGVDPMLHGVCFGRYREGPWHTLSQQEKEELARRLEAEDNPKPPPTPHR